MNRYLVVGSGAREHAIAWALSRNSEVHIMPGNPAMALSGICVKGNQLDFETIAKYASDNAIKSIVPGPELPIVKGISDALTPKGFFVFGPSAKAAQLEGSKAFAKDFMKRNGIPCAQSASFSSQSEALQFVKTHDFPLVIKVDGLAAGKGVMIVESMYEAENALHAIFSENKFGDSGRTVVIEEFLVGKELTVMAITDGNTIKPLLPSRDHKRLEDGDKGPMTGGMGAFCPVPDVGSDALGVIKTEIIEKTLAGIQKEGLEYKGAIYCGLMLTTAGPKVLEYNCRFGDPEAQVVLPMLQTPLSEIIEAVKDQRLDKLPLVFRRGFAACVVLASQGYPNNPVLGKQVFGLEKAQTFQNGAVFAAGVAEENGKILTSGGRVFSCMGMGQTIRQALGRAYSLSTLVDFEGKQMRGDIGGRYGRGKTSIVNLRLKIRLGSLRRGNKGS